MSNDKPILFWMSSPAQPGDTVLVYGSGLAHTTAVHLLRLPDGPPDLPDATPIKPPGTATVLASIQPSSSSVKCILPERVLGGVFALWVETPDGSSNRLLLNQPEVWWGQGNAGEHAHPGGWMRVFGRCLAWGGTAAITVVLKKAPPLIPPPGGPSPILPLYTLKAQGDNYGVRVDLPPNLPEGAYEVYVHNGAGGPFSWSKPLTMKVAIPEQWPTTLFDLRNFHKGDGDPDDTARIAAALDSARGNGGGVVYFPSGSYQISATLDVPPKTVLRGEAAQVQGEQINLSHLLWTNPWNQRLECVIRGHHHFGVEDLTLTFAGANNGILAGISQYGTLRPPSFLTPELEELHDEAGDIFLRRVTMRWLLYGGRNSIPNLNLILTEMTNAGNPATQQDNTATYRFLLAFGGRNIEISDCNLYSAGGLFHLVGVKGANILHNQLTFGRAGWAHFDGCDGVICEDNDFLGADNSVSQGIGFWSFLPLQHIYLAKNTLENVYFRDREGLLTDGESGQYFGSIRSVNGTTITLPVGTTLPPGALKDHLCYVISGTGQGQWRTVVRNTEATLTVDRAWDILPTPDSLIGVNHLVAHFLIVGNAIRDVSVAFAFYGLAMDSIVAENHCYRAGGISSDAGVYPSAISHQPQFFIQYLNNEIMEGLTPIHDAKTGWSFRDSLIRVSAFVGGNQPLCRTWPLALGMVLRGNILASHARLQLLATGGDNADQRPPPIKDVIIERNTVSHSDVGIEVTGNTYITKKAENVVIRENMFQDVPLKYEKVGTDQIDGLYPP